MAGAPIPMPTKSNLENTTQPTATNQTTPPTVNATATNQITPATVNATATYTATIKISPTITSTPTLDVDQVISTSIAERIALYGTSTPIPTIDYFTIRMDGNDCSKQIGAYGFDFDPRLGFVEDASGNSENVGLGCSTDPKYPLGCYSKNLNPQIRDEHIGYDLRFPSGIKLYGPTNAHGKVSEIGIDYVDILWFGGKRFSYQHILPNDAFKTDINVTPETFIGKTGNSPQHIHVGLTSGLGGTYRDKWLPIGNVLCIPK